MGLKNYSAEVLSRKANEFRIEILKMAYSANDGHIGGAFSIIDVMTALYLNILNHDPKNPKWEGRDRLVFSKGHGCLALYPLLAETGYFDKSHLGEFCKDGSLLGGHPETHIPGVEVATGSLGHGLSLGSGMALTAKIDNKEHKVYVVLSDGECNEGSVWEAFAFASQHKLDNLIAIIDSNKYESLGRVQDILSIEPFGERLKVFGWSVREINGHNMEEVLDALAHFPYEKDKASVVIAHTVKGKGVSFMENNYAWHAKKLRKQEEFERAVAELEALLR